jgi:cation diffusion facilitator CzcD-associated flavoprotein CzcO
VVGPSIAAVGFALFAVPGVGASYWSGFFPAVVVLGFGMTVTVAPLTTTVMNAVGPDLAGVASGVNNAVSRAAAVLAIAVFGAIMAWAFDAALAGHLRDMGASPQVSAFLEGERSKLAGAAVPPGAGRRHRRGGQARGGRVVRGGLPLGDAAGRGAGGAERHQRVADDPARAALGRHGQGPSRQEQGDDHADAAAEQHVDVLIVGAGLSGIGAACHLQAKCPGRSYAILEGRERSGGTWDLFRYPGVRSDSDMYTLGYRFRPWTQPKSIADGPAILGYLRDTAAQHGIERHIRFNHRVVRAAWSTPDACWTVDAELGPERLPVRLRCNFLFLCSGYFRYDAGYTPEFKGSADFAGRIVHPQHWPEGLDVSGQRVVVIGSGATAMTLVPALAKTAAHVTLLQRSPTYVVARPAQDGLANALRRVLPARLAYGITRWKNVLLGMFFFRLARRRPERVKRLIVGGVRHAMGPGYDVATHFTPRYNPWDQRVCLVPDGDLFAALKSGRASMVTDHVDTFTPRGLRLQVGQGAGGRPGGDGHRPRAAGAGRHSSSRWTATAWTRPPPSTTRE